MRQWTDADLIAAVKNSKTFPEVARALGLMTYGANSRTIRKYIKKLNLDTSHFYTLSEQLKIARACKKIIPFEEKFKANSTTARKHIKEIIIEQGLLPYSCATCSLNTWLDKPISLHLDHINGQSNDHRLENLRFLCPNCHSQTDSYCGKNLKKDIKTCTDCNAPILRASIRCRACNDRLLLTTSSTKINWPPYEELQALIKLCGSINATAKKLGVSFHAIKKRLKKHAPMNKESGSTRA